MENKAKPRICEVLGVEVGELFTADYPYKDLGKMEVREDGNIDCVTGQVRSNALCYMINHPECVCKIRHWTPEEVELAKAIKVVWSSAYALEYKSELSDLYILIRCRINGLEIIENIEALRFPSLKRGESVLLSDIIGGNENA